ncbi:hypothetical protein K438DRAFT_2045251 [Mycena galopus ATCC 62051]|nr:hypothetical protein K438DRAFT_2045251 [Mycena galopus ATCC 62051]
MTLIHPDSRFYERQMQLILGSSNNPAPGRTLHQVYSHLGHHLETKANRAAHSWGRGPSATADRIVTFFDRDEHRAAKLDELHSSSWSCHEVEEECSKLAKYALPGESAQTQIQAFQYIATTITRYPGTRALFLKSKHLRRVANTEAAISATWARADDTQPREWDFHCNLAAASLFETEIYAILGSIPPGCLGFIGTDSGHLSAIERLLVASESGMNSISDIIAQRYLSGILELPAFWRESGPIYTNVFSKILNHLIRVLQDLGLESGDKDDHDLIFNNEGINSLASAILVGVSGWHSIRAESWYQSLVEIVRLLRVPKAQNLLPKSSVFVAGPEIIKVIPNAESETLEMLTMVYVRLRNGGHGWIGMLILYVEMMVLRFTHADHISLRELGDAVNFNDPIQVISIGPQRMVYTTLASGVSPWTTIRSEFSRLLRWPGNLRKRLGRNGPASSKTARRWIPRWFRGLSLRYEYQTPTYEYVAYV